MRLPIAFLVIFSFSAFAQQPPAASSDTALDSRDQAAGKATPSQDTAPPPASTGTPPANPNADAETLHREPPKATEKAEKDEKNKKDAASGATEAPKELDEQPRDVRKQ